MDSFSLTKWYQDSVDPAGRAAIAYSTALAWRGLMVSWHAVALYEPGSSTREWTSMARTDLPARENGRITWQPRALGATFAADPLLDPFNVRFIDDNRGVVDWTCEAGAARTSVALGNCSVEGLGYAERLLLTVAPWRLPIDEMRWGRWISADGRRAIVWIDWRGAEPATAVFVNGVRQAGAVVTDDHVTADRLALTLSSPRVLHARSIGDILARIRPLGALVPASWLAVEDRKCLSVGTLDAADRATGWAIHETVRFP
jgi:hypothetical protein